MSEIVEKIQKASVNQLSQMVIETIVGVEKSAPAAFVKIDPLTDKILDGFTVQMNLHFDELLDKETHRVEAVFNYEDLSLVQEDELEVMVALEGMVNASRNEHLPSFISFNTRLNSLFAKKRIDETTNPLDPDQIASAFQEALRPASLSAPETLSVYRVFNENVLKRLNVLLQKSNQVLIENGVIPDLGMESSKKKDAPSVRREAKRPDTISAFGTVEEESFEDDGDSPELFSMMQNLMHPGATEQPKPQSATSEPTATSGGTSSASASGELLPEGHVAVPIEQAQILQAQQFMVPAAMLGADSKAGDGSSVMQPFQPAPGQEVQMVDQAKLMEVLSNIQSQLETRLGNNQIPTSETDVERIDISQSLGEMLSADNDDKVVTAVDRQSSDIINLVTLLYEAIWQDESVPIPIKELIGRTQITIIKVALSDTSFFDRENHPARVILNEFAAAGIGWIEVESLGEDPLYQEIQRLVSRIQSEYSGDMAFFEALIKEFRTFRAREAAKTRQLEQSILKAKERKERLDDIHELVNQKIDERLLGREIHPFAKDLLEQHFHKFMVMLVLKEGPGGNAWKQAINTIDVLLWTVQPHDVEDDRNRLATINPRLLNNLRKAFRIAGIEIPEIDGLIVKLQEVQQETFAGVPAPKLESRAEENDLLPSLEAAQKASDEGLSMPEAEPAQAAAAAIEPDPEPEEDLTEYLNQIDTLSVGIWVEFVGEDDMNTRCKLAAKISAIDKFIFVNRQGVKVVEKTKQGLAREIKDGTVKIISDGLLFSRALESVIGNLRESQQKQQTGGAYRPNAQA